MKIFKELIKFLTSREFFTGINQRMFNLLVSVSLVLGFFYLIFNYPIILLIVIVIGMMIMAAIMFYFLFPDSHQQINAVHHYIFNQLNKLKKRFLN